MFKNKQLSPPTYIFFILIAITASFTSCKEEGCTDPEAINFNDDADKSCNGCCDYPQQANVKVTITHEIDDQQLELNKKQYSNPFNRTYEVTKLRYIISDFKFHRGDGSAYDSDMYQLVNVKEDSTMTFIIPNVPSGDYTKASFFFGLDEEKNQDGALPAIELGGMPWPAPLGDGYHFMQLEGRYDSSGTMKPFNTHMGMKKVNDSTFENNHVTISLQNSNMSVSYRTWTLELTMNINEWYRNPNDYDFPKYGKRIMGNPNAQQTLHDNAATIFTLETKAEE